MISISLRALSNGDTFTVDPPPQSIRCRIAGRWVSYDLLKPGPADFMNGKEPREVSWQGTLLPWAAAGVMPNWDSRENRTNNPPGDWIRPLTTLKQLTTWHDSNEKLELTILMDGDTTNPHPFDKMRCHLYSFNWEHASGLGGIVYDIVVREAIEIGVVTSVQTQKMISASEQVPKQYTVGSSITPFELAKKYTGQTANTDELVSLLTVEQKTYLVNNGTLPLGTVLTIPESWRKNRTWQP